LTAVKRPDRFLAAAERVAVTHPGTIFLLAGDGDLRAELEAVVDRADVRFLGWQGDVTTIYAASDLVVLTSDNEGMPITLIEASLAGRACVATDVGSTSEVVLHGLTGLLTPCDPEALAEAISGLMDDPERRSRFGTAAREHALATFGLAELTLRLADVYARPGSTRLRR
jgi:glycosyltransferase involved in cell wall biosynthesis